MAKHHSKRDKAKKKYRKAAETIPAEIKPTEDARPIVTRYGTFDLEDPALAAWVEKRALKSDHYPFDKALDDDFYDDALAALRVELVKMQTHIVATGGRIVALMEGRDAAGKGGTIGAIGGDMNPRTTRSVALPKPTDRERGEWYFQRYVAHLPAAGEIVLFDRSWYNRAGVEPVMGFCTDSEARKFLLAAPVFEKMLVEDGILLFKFWLSIGREMQLKRFHERRHNPLKIWKLSPIDYAAMEKWDAYTRARNVMMKATHTSAAPWTVVLSNDKRRARLEVIRHVLNAVDYPGRDLGIIGKADRRIVGGPGLLKK